MSTLVECIKGKVETSVGGETYCFERDKHNRFVAEVHEPNHVKCLVAVEHYRIAPDVEAEKSDPEKDEKGEDPAANSSPSDTNLEPTGLGDQVTASTATPAPAASSEAAPAIPETEPPALVPAKPRSTGQKTQAKAAGAKATGSKTTSSKAAALKSLSTPAPAAS